jgi:hypothetical protein
MAASHDGARGGGRGERRGGGPDGALIRVCDLAGRPRGTGFLADADGTMVTSHEAVDGLARLVLHAPGEQVCLVEASAVTELPELGLALVATEGLDLPPLPIAPGGPAHPEQRIRLRLPHRTAGSVVGVTAVTYTATDRFHLIDEVYELALDGVDLSGADVHGVAPQASGAPVIDAATGAVLAVVVTALHAGHRAGGFAVPLRAGSAPTPLAELLERNAATVPAYGAHLNLAGALHLTGTSLGSAAGPGQWREPVARPEIADALADFLSRRGERAPLALGLVGEPGTGRSTELAALAVRRARGPHPAPTVWLRGAELRPGDGGIKDAVERALRTAARIVSAAGQGRPGDPLTAAPVDDPTDAVATLALAAGRPLVVLLDAPEEMPPVLAHALADWAAGTASWLRATRTRLVVAGRPEFWEQAGALLPGALLYEGGGSGVARPLPPCVRMGDLAAAEAGQARERYGLSERALGAADAAHPLALRLLSEVRAACEPEPDPGQAPPSRVEVLSAHLDLVCLRIAVRLAAAPGSPARGTGVRRLAARVSGQVHEAARRCLGPGQGELEREAFEELFPWRTGWASAVLTEGLLVPAGAGYRFAHEELADWLQSLHLDVPVALHALVHRWSARSACPPAGPPPRFAEEPAGGPPEAPVRLPARSGKRAGQPPPVPPAPPVAPAGYPRSLPVPRHRAGPVVLALLHAPQEALAAHLAALVEALDEGAPPAPPGEADLDADTVPTPRTRWGARREAARPEGGRVEAARPAQAAAGGEAQAQAGGRAGARAQVLGQAQAVEPYGTAGRREEARWWAAHLLREVLLRVADAAPYRETLRALAGRIVARCAAADGFGRERLGGLGEFGPWFWLRLPLAADERLELLRVLLPADGPPPETGGGRDRFLAACAELLRADYAGTLRAVCGWFDDDRPLRVRGADGPRLTVASAAQALLHTHRRLAVDDLIEALAGAAHPGADAVLAALAEDEPSAVCRAVDRWAHDPRPERHAAAATYGTRAAPFARCAADRELLRYTALAILARPADRPLHGAALGLLVRDPATRARHLPTAIRLFADGDPGLSAGAMAAALPTDPERVLGAFRARLRGGVGTAPAAGGGCPVADAGSDAAPGVGPGVAEALAELAAVSEPGLARRACAMVEDHLRARPQDAADVARYLDLRLEQGPGARAALLPLAAALLRDHPAAVRCALVPVFAAPGSRLSRALRQELLDCALETERDPDVLDALLTAAAEGSTARHPLLTRDLVHRLALLLGRTPDGAARFDRRAVALAATHPSFARLLRTWLTDTPIWDPLLGPSARRALDAVG